jgi:hypothetical protein
MNADDREKLSIELCRLWPKRFEDAELRDWETRLDRYRLDDVLTALNDYKNSSKFRPQVSEILGRLKGKEATGTAVSTPIGMNFVQVLRQQNEQYRGRSDAEVILRYWRAIWWRYRDDADKRTPMPEQSAEVKARFDQQRDAMETKCRTSCQHSLFHAGKTVDEAAQLAAWIFSPPDQFRTLLEELRLEHHEAGVKS